MKWEKLGLVYQAKKYQLPWAQNSALTPTPILIGGNVIRVYFSARDKLGVGRIRFIDLCASDPTKILRVGNEISLDVGFPGTFDDNGVILGDVLIVENVFYMFYVGFQLVKQAKFLAFSGLSKSLDGIKFNRCSQVPILDRADEGRYIRAIHTAMFQDGRWRIWYAAGNHWENILGNDFPQYDVRYCEATTLDQLPKEGIETALMIGKEYRLGRPKVYFLNHQYHMFFTYGTLRGDYLPGYAYSKDGVSWIRHDDLLGISLSKTGWDAKHLCYPALLTVNDQTYMFYNGNDMGYEGFGCARLIKE